MKSIVIDPTADVIVVDGVEFVRTVAEPPAQAPKAKGGKRGPRKQGPNESDEACAARVARYNKTHKIGQPEPVASVPATASLPTREASDKAKPKAFTTTLCKCRGDKQKSKKEGTYGKPGYTPAVYEPTTDFTAFGIEGPLEIPQGNALCGTFRKKEGEGTFDATVYHTGHGTRNGDWLQLMFYDEATGEAKGTGGRPLFKGNADIVELFLMPCNCVDCKAARAS